MNPTKEQIASDARCFMKYMEGLDEFHGNVEQSKKDLYADVKLKKEKVKELETVKKNIDIIFKEKEPRRRERDLER